MELKDGGGAKLFKDGNLEPHVSEDALETLRPEAAPAVERPPVAERPKSFLERSREQGAEASAAAVAAAAAVAKGGGVSEASTEDDEAFVRSIEQCLKARWGGEARRGRQECDVMWDDY